MSSSCCRRHLLRRRGLLLLLLLLARVGLEGCGRCSLRAIPRQRLACLLRLLPVRLLRLLLRLLLPVGQVWEELLGRRVRNHHAALLGVPAGFARRRRVG